MDHEMQKKIAKGFELLARGIGADGKPLFAAKLGAEASEAGREYAKNVAIKQIIAAQKLGHKRFKG